MGHARTSRNRQRTGGSRRHPAAIAQREYDSSSYLDAAEAFRRAHSPLTTSPAALATLQRTVGNRAVEQIVTAQGNAPSLQRNGGGTTGGQSVNSNVNAPEVDSAFTKVAPLLDKAAPTAGSGGSVECKLKIPLTVTSFLQFELEGSVERDEEGVEVKFDVALGGGLGTGIFGLSPEIVAKLGGFVESKGKTSKEAMKLISYSLYRNFREAGERPREAANYLWGGDVTAYEAAEKWAADMEKEIFAKNEKAQVKLGSYGALEATTGEIGSFELGGGVKLASSMTYSKETLEKTQQLGKVNKEKDQGWILWGLKQVTLGYIDRGAQKSVGSGNRDLEFSVEAKAGPLSGSGQITIPMEGLTPKRGEYKFEMEAEGELPGKSSKPKAIANLIVDLASNILKVIQWIKAKSAEKSDMALSLGPTADSLFSLVGQYASNRAALAQALGDQLSLDDLVQKSVTVSIEAERDENKKLKKTLSVGVKQGVEIKAPADVLEVKVERGQKLLELEGPPF